MATSDTHSGVILTASGTPPHAHGEQEHGDHPADGSHDAPATHEGHAGHGGHDKHAGHDPEMFRRRFWLSLVLTIPLVVTGEMVMDWFNYSLDFWGIDLLGPVLGSIVFWWGGWPFLAGGVTEVRDRQPGMMLLISMAITVAYVASLATSLDWFDLDFWWELAALVTIMLLGHWQEMKAIGQAQGALAALAELLPDDAERVGPDGQVETVSITGLRVGDVVLVRSGARVPADGQIVDGEAELDESMITGESRPVGKGPGDKLVAGTVSTDSAIRVRVEAVGDDTALAGIRRLVAEAQASGSRAQVLADRFAALLFYIATAAGIVTFLVWWALGNLDNSVVRTVTVLVIACPHALGLAIPLVIAISTTLGARNGLLVKDRLALERAREVRVVIFDKTGTLTRGEPVVAGIVAAPGTDEDELLALAAAVEGDSEHPLARAVVRAAGDRRLVPRAATAFESLAGRGAAATVNGQDVRVGSARLVEELGAQIPPPVAAAVEQWSQQGRTVLFTIADGTVRGALALEDEIRPESAEAVSRLHEMGLRVAMITGDAQAVADSVARRTGIDQTAAQVLPPEKAAAVRRFQDGGVRVAMVGDGVNDAPALAQADVGIAIGAGTDVAVESAGIVLVRSDPRDVAAAIVLSRAAYRKMVQNLVWATAYNAIAIPVAAGLFVPWGFSLPMSVGALVMSVSTIVVAANAQLLRGLKLRPYEPAQKAAGQPQPA
jgi:P-type Cu2+ transporter